MYPRVSFQHFGVSYLHFGQKTAQKKAQWLKILCVMLVFLCIRPHMMWYLVLFSSYFQWENIFLVEEVTYIQGQIFIGLPFFVA